MTRQEYMERYSGASKAEQEAMFREYYAQFVGPYIRSFVKSCIGEDRIKASTNPHFNDIPLAEWDRLDAVIRPIGARINKEINGASVWSLSDTVCVAKEAARQLKEAV
ncbi:hypothetical protein [Paraburkholderia youngii]|uniref:Uncharacterized protein n=1 Tax=Paraburkholderia youngii TaxID=2782701 RepID=A0A7Y6JVI1_9BURK|nr:hypothetical protein [Paraburkholderia youngii]NUX98748.1 hypothetical protein [Paraburkholderia youngii]